MLQAMLQVSMITRMTLFVWVGWSRCLVLCFNYVDTVRVQESCRGTITYYKPFVKVDCVSVSWYAADQGQNDSARCETSRGIRDGDKVEYNGERHHMPAAAFIVVRTRCRARPPETLVYVNKNAISASVNRLHRAELAYMGM